MDTRAQNLREPIGFFGFFYIIPMALLYFGILPFQSMFGILTLVGIILAAYAADKPIKARDLGFRADNLKSSLLWSSVLTIFGLVVIAFLWGKGILTSGYQNSVGFYIFYILISAPLQEFIFRSLVIYELTEVFDVGKTSRVLFSAFLFSLAHSMYHSLPLMAITFTAGLAWGILYVAKPNFYGLALSHIVLGFATVLTGIV